MSSIGSRTGKGPVKADHTIYKPSGADTPSSAAPIGGKTPIERLRKTPSPTADKLSRKSPSPTHGGSALRPRTPTSPTSSFCERLRTSSGQKALGSPVTRPTSTTPRKTHSPSDKSDLRRSPDTSPAAGGSVAPKRKSLSARAGGQVPIKRSMSAVLLQRAGRGDVGFTRSQPASRTGTGNSGAGTHGRATPTSLDMEMAEARRFLPGHEMQMIESLALRLKELRRIGGRTTESGTQTVTDAGTQTIATTLGAAGNDEDDGDDGEVAQIDNYTERTGLRPGNPLLRGSTRSSSAASDPAGRCELDETSVPVEMMAGLGLSGSSPYDRPKQPTAIYLSGEAYYAPTYTRSSRTAAGGEVGRRSRANSTSPLTVGAPAWPAAAEALTRQMRPPANLAYMRWGGAPSFKNDRESGESDMQNESSFKIESSFKNDGDLPNSRVFHAFAERGGSEHWNTDDDNDDDHHLELREIARSQQHAQATHAQYANSGAYTAGGDRQASYAHAPGPDPVKMFSDGRHNASMLGANAKSPSSAPSSPPASRRRPSSRGARPQSPGGAEVFARGNSPMAHPRDAWTENMLMRSAGRESDDSMAGAHPRPGTDRGTHRRTGSWEVDERPPTKSAAKSPKQNGTSLFGADIAAAAAGKQLSLPVPARPARSNVILHNAIPRLDLSEVERPRTALGNGQARLVAGRPSAGVESSGKDARASPRGLVTSRSDVSIGSPRSAFTSVSSPRSTGGSTNSTPRSVASAPPLPPIVQPVQRSFD